jgi:type I restriction enzyme M protein
MKKEQLSSLIKSARDIMRKDRNLDTDVKRIPTLSWLFFLKCFDGLEQRRETESVLKRKSFRPAIKKPYRWQDWAVDEAGVTGDELLKFINNDLFPYLKGLTGTDEYDQRDVISALFREITNEARSGYLLRDVINLVNKINFNSADDIHTLSHIYESMLRELRDAAGQNGEFYTPRPVVRFIVEMIAPELGETVLDPAAGTGGFLVEAYEYLKKQQKKAEDRKVLQHQTLYGIEKKPMPYLLGTMNLLLHGIERPNYQETNSLAVNLNDITDSRRYDCIITNPPFGGEEETGIKSGFPEDKQTSETTLLFLQLIMRSLRKPAPTGGIKGGRCGMVVPNGTLFGDGVCARIKKELLEEFNLHTIVRLPNGVFAPYASIQTNLLFFDRSGPTKQIWYYEHPLPEGRKNYTKTRPLQFEEFKPCLKWWNNRKKNKFAWRVKIKDVIKNNYNLDIKNPRGKVDYEHLPPEKLVKDILKKEQRIAQIMVEIKKTIEVDK